MSLQANVEDLNIAISELEDRMLTLSNYQSDEELYRFRALERVVADLRKLVR